MQNNNNNISTEGGMGVEWEGQGRYGSSGKAKEEMGGVGMPRKRWEEREG